MVAPLDAALHAPGNKIATGHVIIAATALAHGPSVITRDAKRFPRIPGLKHHLFWR